jgi:hypothetical protein
MKMAIFSEKLGGRGEAVTILWCNCRVGHIQRGVVKVDKVQSTYRYVADNTFLLIKLPFYGMHTLVSRCLLYKFHVWPTYMHEICRYLVSS